MTVATAAAIATASPSPNGPQPSDTHDKQDCSPTTSTAQPTSPRKRHPSPTDERSTRRRCSRSRRQPPLAWTSWPPSWPWSRSARRVPADRRISRDRRALRATEAQRERLRRLLRYRRRRQLPAPSRRAPHPSPPPTGQPERSALRPRRMTAIATAIDRGDRGPQPSTETADRNDRNRGNE